MKLHEKYLTTEAKVDIKQIRIGDLVAYKDARGKAIEGKVTKIREPWVYIFTKGEPERYNIKEIVFHKKVK